MAKLYKLNQKSRPLLLLITVLSLLAFKVWFLKSSFENVIDQENWVRHTNQVTSELDLTLSAAADAETGVRGYLLTAKEDYLEPYSQGTTEAFEHIKNVKTLTLDNPEQHQSSLAIEDLLVKRFSLLESLKVAFTKANGKVDRSSLNFVEGKSIMDAIRGQVAKMKQRENVLLEARSEAAEKSKNIFTWVLYLSNVILAGVLIFAFFQIIRNIERAMAEASQKSLVSLFAKAIAGNLSLRDASGNILRNLANEFGILAGKVFVLEGRQLRMAGSYGVSELDVSSAGEGFAEAALDREKPSQFNDIPKDYWRVSSGLGERQASSLSFFPLEFQGARVGLIELASFQPLNAEKMELIASLTDTLGIGLNAAFTRTKMQALLETTQQQSEELQAQQEELKASNEELEQQARALESQQQALNLKNNELEVTQGQLEIRAKDLERSTRYKSEFLAKMSHELRTPLNGLLILSTLLSENKEKNLTNQQLQFANSIHSAGNDLLLLINDILDLSKIEARKLSLRPEDFSLGELLDSIKVVFDPQVQAKSLRLQTDLPTELRNFVLHTDRQRLDQVLRNFLSNSIKFTQKGSITVVGEVSADGLFVTVRVIDTGIGIAKNKQQLVFEAFEQADSSVSREYGGTGLGLTISRELAYLLGGNISVASVEGEGSTFSITFPAILPKNTLTDEGTPTHRTETYSHIARDMNGAAEVSAQDVQQEVKNALKSVSNEKTILIVEDDENFRISVAEAARSYGFQTIEAADGEVALGILKSHVPSAILLDIKLPGISGLGILEMIKQMPHLRHIPVHMISGLDYQQNALRMGALGYLTKPVTIDKVRSALGRIEKLISTKLRKVLLVEDDKNQSLAVSELISGTDLEVIICDTGSGALEKVQTEGFDCIILDLTLPDVSGFDLLDELKHLEISLPPIVIYTGKDLTPEEDQYLRKFSESIIIKGARSPERLLDEVNLFLHRVESLLPEQTREMLSALRSQEKSFDGKTVLVVDDDIRNIFALTSALEAKGLKIRVARDGAEALESIETNTDIDIVLMDIMMPKMDGFEAMRQIRRNPDPRIKNLPVVALTAKAMKEDHENCIEAGASDYLPKPVNLQNLMTILKVWLSPKGLFN